MTGGGCEQAGAVRLCGVRLDAVTMAEAVRRIVASLEAGVGGQVVTPNLDILRQTRRDAWLREVVNGADLALADGMPLVWASRLRGTPLPERVAGSTLVLELARACAVGGHRLFLLGGDPGAAEAAAARLVERFPGLVVAGTHCPPMGFERDPVQMQVIRDRLAAADAAVVYVALGCPKQERLIEAVRGVCPRAWWLGVGISLSFIAGDVKRAPRWMQRMGLEWVHRLVQEPRRLFRRYLVDGVPFGVYLLGEAVVQRVRGVKDGPDGKLSGH